MRCEQWAIIVIGSTRMSIPATIKQNAAIFLNLPLAALKIMGLCFALFVAWEFGTVAMSDRLYREKHGEFEQVNGATLNDIRAENATLRAELKRCKQDKDFWAKECIIQDRKCARLVIEKADCVKLLVGIHHDGKTATGHSVLYGNPTDKEWIDRRDALLKELGYDYGD